MNMRHTFAAALLALTPGLAQAAIVGDSVESGGFRFTLVQCGTGCALTDMIAATDGIGFDLNYNGASVDAASGSMDYTLGFAIEAIEGAGRALTDLFSVTLGTVGSATGSGYINVTENVAGAGTGATFTSTIQSKDQGGGKSITREYRSDLGISDDELASLSRIGFYKDHFLTPGDDGGSATLTKVTQRFQLNEQPAPIPVPAALPLLAGGFAVMSFVARRRKKQA